ncbi:MAG TPA: HDOD domain-containing protein [Kineosporiaceae bacterium]|nr:HDOD domain-containing protein [Kineosporiaceae bacterium]
MSAQTDLDELDDGDLVAPRPAPAPDLVRQVRVARQGLYDGRRQLAGYRVVFGVPEANGRRGAPVAIEPGADQAGAAAIAAAFGSFGVEGLADGKPLFVGLPRAFLTGIVPIPAEPGSVVLELGPHAAPDAELILALTRLKQAGYRIAVGDHRGDAARAALVELADVVSVPLTALPSLVVPGLVAACRRRPVTLVASGIEDAATFALAVELGFDLFEGHYLQRPMLLERRVLTPSQLVCVRLLGELADPDLPMSRIEQLVGSDPGLVLRVLRTANSAATGTAAELNSLRQALVLLGPRRLRSWVVLALLDGGSSRDVSHDVWSVLARAQATQRLAPGEPELGYTVGLLSGAAELLGAQVDDVADGARLGADARSALLAGSGNAGRALTAVLAHERDDVDAVSRTGLEPLDVSHAYLESLRASLQLVHELQGE